ncbi:MAG TPA: glycoside hydrolase family 38 C-terminal domain-containing protein, partial [Herpetosiphonaceae bacterium]|nr:glycoside hydrolase family 38 C-terminal domain-containing protein [Herpetosiphonaceae bacterium]
RCAGELKSPFDDIMCFYGVGNHGGGPTVENIASIRRLDEDPTLPRLVFSTPDRFFAEVTAKDLPFPVVHDELQHHASGCYAAHSGVKRWNRQAENLLSVAEKFSAVAAWVTGQPYSTEFNRAWKNVLFNQFHDILAGTSLPAAYDDARNGYGEAMSIAARALNDAVQSLAWNIDIEHEQGMTPIVVFNPHSWAAKMDVEMEFGGLREGDVLLDDTGAQVPLQTVKSTVVVSGWRKRLSFVADLPPLGYRVYRVVGQPSRLDVGPIAADDTSMENEYFSLVFEPATGAIASLFDKQQQVDVFVSPGARAVVIDDPSDTWSHGVYQFHHVAGTFTATSLRRVEHGPVKSVIRVESAYGDSKLVQEFTMYRELPQIEVRVTVDWREQFKMLKLQFPVNLNFLRATYEIPYGFIERPANGEEEPGLSWVDLSGVARGNDVPYGLSVLNDGKYSFDVQGRVISLTALRSPIYAHHHPTQPQPGEPYEFIDQGVQRFTYTLLPHAGSWEHAGTV